MSKETTPPETLRAIAAIQAGEHVENNLRLLVEAHGDAVTKAAHRCPDLQEAADIRSSRHYWVHRAAMAYDASRSRDFPAFVYMTVRWHIARHVQSHHERHFERRNGRRVEKWVLRRFRPVMENDLVDHGEGDSFDYDAARRAIARLDLSDQRLLNRNNNNLPPAKRIRELAPYLETYYREEIDNVPEKQRTSSRPPPRPPAHEGRGPKGQAIVATLRQLRPGQSFFVPSTASSYVGIYAARNLVEDETGHRFAVSKRVERNQPGRRIWRLS